MLKAWNKNMVEQSTLSHVSCLDESMRTWTNNTLAPGGCSCKGSPGPLAMSMTQCVAHCQAFLAQVGRGEGCTLNNPPEIQQSRKNSRIVASNVAAHLWKGQRCGPGQWFCI